MRQHVKVHTSKIAQAIERKGTPRRAAGQLARSSTATRERIADFLASLKLIQRQPLGIQSHQMHGKVRVLGEFLEKTKLTDAQIQGMDVARMAQLMAERANAELQHHFFSLVLKNNGNIHHTMGLLLKNKYSFDMVEQILDSKKK